MVDSSDFETDVGTMDVYARGADPVYVTAPSSSQQEEGVKPLDRLPAQWWNWFLHEATNRFSNYKSYISNALAELDNLLDLSAIAPDDTKTNQLKGMFENDYLQKYPDSYSGTLCLNPISRKTFGRNCRKTNDTTCSRESSSSF